MKQYNVGSPLERIALAISEPFPESDQGNKYILMVMNYFTKWLEGYAIPNQETKSAAEVLVKEFISRFEVSLELHTDQGRNFRQWVFERLAIHKTWTTALHPQSLRMVERIDRTIGKYLSNHQKDRDLLLPFFLKAYRSAVYDSVGQTPAQILFYSHLENHKHFYFILAISSCIVTSEKQNNAHATGKLMHVQYKGPVSQKWIKVNPSLIHGRRHSNIA